MSESDELQAPDDHPAVCWKLCDPSFENAPHIHTPQGVFIVDIIDPKSERGQQMIRNAAYMKPTTQGDPPPVDDNAPPFECAGREKPCAYRGGGHESCIRSSSDRFEMACYQAWRKYRLTDGTPAEKTDSLPVNGAMYVGPPPKETCDALIDKHSNLHCDKPGRHAGPCDYLLSDGVWASDKLTKDVSIALALIRIPSEELHKEIKDASLRFGETRIGNNGPVVPLTEVTAPAGSVVTINWRLEGGAVCFWTFKYRPTETSFGMDGRGWDTIDWMTEDLRQRAEKAEAERTEWICRFNKLPEIVARAEERGECRARRATDEPHDQVARAILEDIVTFEEDIKRLPHHGLVRIIAYARELANAELKRRAHV